MRALLLLAPLVLTGCSSYDGNWLLQMVLKESTYDPESEGEEMDLYGQLYELTEGKTAFEVEGILMVGLIDGTSFEFEYAIGESYSYEGCSQLAVESKFTFSGDFTPDLGLEGDLEMTQEQAVTDCGNEEAEIYGARWEATGLLLAASESNHPQGGMAFGYFGGGGSTY